MVLTDFRPFLRSKIFLLLFYGTLRKKKNRNFNKIAENPIFGPPYNGPKWKLSVFFYFTPIYDPSGIRSRNRNLWNSPEGWYFCDGKWKNHKITKNTLKNAKYSDFLKPRKKLFRQNWILGLVLLGKTIFFGATLAIFKV